MNARSKAVIATTLMLALTLVVLASGALARTSTVAGCNDAAQERALLDDSSGCTPVNPLSLNPPAVQEDQPYWTGTACKCWELAEPATGPSPTVGADSHAPGGATIRCFHGPSTHKKGDGSLESDATGLADQFFGFACPDGGPNVFDVGQDMYVDAVRYYDED